MGIPATLSTVPAQTPYIQYVATSGQTVFPYPFEITQDSDLVVVANGTTLSTDSGYTLSGVGNATGGNLTFTSGRTVGDIITLYRDIPIERLTQFAQNGGFSSTAFNAEFNNVYLLLQQLQQNIDQCLQIPNTNNPAPTTTLQPASYAGYYLTFDSHGNPTPGALVSAGSITAPLVTGLFAQSGVFTNTQMNPVFISYTTGASTKTEYQATQGAQYTTDAVVGAVEIPTDSTVYQANGVSGYAVNRTTAGAPGTAAVGMYGQGRANSTVAGARCWGANFVSAARTDSGGNTSVGATLYGVEVDVCPGNASDGTAGVVTLLNGTVAGYTGGSAFQAGGELPWNIAFESRDGCANIALLAGASVTSGTGDSQPIRFYYYSGGTESYQTLYVDSSGSLTTNADNLITNNIKILANGNLNGIQITDSSAGPVPGITLGTGTYGRGAGVAFLGSDSSQGVNWLIANQYNSAGVLEITPSTANGGSTFTTPLVQLSSGSVAVSKPVVLPVYTVATLPAASSALKGAIAAVSDATSPTYHGALTGGGTVYVPVFCDGSSWTSH